MGMELDIEKCDMLTMTSGKSEKRREIELTNQERIKMLGEKDNYKYFGILKANTIKQTEMKEKVRKEFFRRTRILLETKFCGRNFVKEINSWLRLLSVTLDHS